MSQWVRVKPRVVIGVLNDFAHAGVPHAALTDASCRAAADRSPALRYTDCSTLLRALGRMHTKGLRRLSSFALLRCLPQILRQANTCHPASHTDIVDLLQGLSLLCPNGHHHHHHLDPTDTFAHHEALLLRDRFILEWMSRPQLALLAHSFAAVDSMTPELILAVAEAYSSKRSVAASVEAPSPTGVSCLSVLLQAAERHNSLEAVRLLQGTVESHLAFGGELRGLHISTTVALACSLRVSRPAGLTSAISRHLGTLPPLPVSLLEGASLLRAVSEVFGLHRSNLHILRCVQRLLRAEPSPETLLEVIRRPGRRGKPSNRLKEWRLVASAEVDSVTPRREEEEKEKSAAAQHHPRGDGDGVQPLWRAERRLAELLRGVRRIRHGRWADELLLGLRASSRGSGPSGASVFEGERVACLVECCTVSALAAPPGTLPYARRLRIAADAAALGFCLPPLVLKLVETCPPSHATPTLRLLAVCRVPDPGLYLRLARRVPDGGGGGGGGGGGEVGSHPYTRFLCLSEAYLAVSRLEESVECDNAVGVIGALLESDPVLVGLDVGGSGGGGGVRGAAVVGVLDRLSRRAPHSSIAEMSARRRALFAEAVSKGSAGVSASTPRTGAGVVAGGTPPDTPFGVWDVDRTSRDLREISRLVSRGDARDARAGPE